MYKREREERLHVKIWICEYIYILNISILLREWKNLEYCRIWITFPCQALETPRCTRFLIIHHPLRWNLLVLSLWQPPSQPLSQPVSFDSRVIYYQCKGSSLLLGLFLYETIDNFHFRARTHWVLAVCDSISFSSQVHALFSMPMYL